MSISRREQGWKWWQQVLRWGPLGPLGPGGLVCLPRCQMCLCTLRTRGLSPRDAHMPKSSTRSHARRLPEPLPVKSCPTFFSFVSASTAEAARGLSRKVTKQPRRRGDFLFFCHLDCFAFFFQNYPRSANGSIFVRKSLGSTFGKWGNLSSTGCGPSAAAQMAPGVGRVG